MTETRDALWVGPVFQKSAVADAMIAAIRQLNQNVKVQDRGAYTRVSVLGRCVLRRQAAEQHLGRPLKFPSDLEKVMPSFEGRLRVDEEAAEWN
jgi:hypothetical protein